MYRAVFLDRDNTIIHNDDDLGDPEQVNLIQGAASAIASLRGLGYKVIVVTNQGGVARGKYSEADVDAVHRRLNELVKKQSGAVIDRFYFCPYHPQGVVEQYKREHPWRKPQPGMLLQAAMDMNLDLRQCWMVGDQVRDVQAGKAASTRTILLQDLSRAVTHPPEADHVVGTLAEAARVIADRQKQAQADSEPPDEPLMHHADPPAKLEAPPPQPAPMQPRKNKTTPTTAPPTEAPTLFNQPNAQDKPSDIPIRNENPASGTGVPPVVRRGGPTEPDDLIQDGDIPDVSVVKPVAAAPPPPVAPAPTPRIAPKPRLVAADPIEGEPASPQKDSNSYLLAQILRELKQGRVHHDDFSWARLAAVLLQTLAAGLACIALFNWHGEYYFDWLLLAVFGQLATVASLLFARKGA